MRISKYISAGVLVYSSLTIANDSTICQGKHAIYDPKAIVHIKYPDTKGLPLDQASRIKTERVDLVRDMLKKAYFNGGTWWQATSEQESEFRETVGTMGVTPRLQEIKDNYTFRFPLSVVKSVFHATNAQYWQHYGFNFDTGAWEASTALRNADFLWANYVYRETQVTEVDRESGEVVFELRLNLDLFCQTGVARFSLISQ